MHHEPINPGALRAQSLSLFPAMDSLDEALAFAESRLPVMNKNELVSVLCIYHNTLLKTLR